MIAGGLCVWDGISTCGNFLPLVGKIFPPDCRQIAAFQLVNLIKKIILEPPTPTEAALVGIAH